MWEDDRVVRQPFYHDALRAGRVPLFPRHVLFVLNIPIGIVGESTNNFINRNRATSGFEIYFALSTFGAAGLNQNTVSIQHKTQLTPTVCILAFLRPRTPCFADV